MKSLKRTLLGLFAMMMVAPAFSLSSALANDWSYDWGYNAGNQDYYNYDTQLNIDPYQSVLSNEACGQDGIKCSDWGNEGNAVNTSAYTDYYNQTYTPNYYSDYPYSNWDFANDANWSNNDYWSNQGGWDDWYNRYRDNWRNYYQANVQNRDYHPINISYYDRDDRYSVLADNNNYQRRIIWANRNNPIGRFVDYPDSWYNSWRNWRHNYARGVAIRDRNNLDNVIIIANANDINGNGSYINIERATVIVDSDAYNEICSIIDRNDGRNYDFRFNRYDNTMGYDYEGNWRSYNASYSYY